MTALLMGVSGAWAMDFTWTSGVDFLTQTSTGNATFGWFSIVTPFNGTISSLKINLGVNNSGRVDAYLGISSDLKATTSGLSTSDFVAISTNTCGTSDYEVTMNFNNELAGGQTYYCYFLTKNGDTYTTVSQRYHVATGQTAGKMYFGSIGSTTASHSEWAAPVSCTMTITDGSYYRVKGNWPSDLVDCWIYSNSGNEDKLYKIKVSDKGTPAVTEDRYIWKTVIDGGIKIQNVGSSRYIPKFTSASTNGATVDYLSATSVSDAVAFTPNDRVAYGKMGYVSLKTTYNSTDTWLNTFTNQNTYVGCHSSVHSGDIFLFQQVKKVTFSQAVAVNEGDAVSIIYVAADGSDSFTLPSSYLYSTDGGTTTMTNTEAATAIAAAGNDDIIVAVSNNPSRNVTYTLEWSDGTEITSVEDISANLSAPASEFVPSAFVSDFTTLSFSPSTVTDETTTVTVTATWNGPFQLSTSFASAKWYTVGMHTFYKSDNHIWKYNSETGNIETVQVPTSEYWQLQNANLFCFMGNPYTGLTIYNRAAGERLALYKSTTAGEQATMAASGSLFIPQVSEPTRISGNYGVSDGYACFQLKDNTLRLNCYASNNYSVYGWEDNSEGSTCWFIPAGQYYLNYIDALGLDAPVGAVGTKAYFTTVANPATEKSNITGYRSTIANNLYLDVSSTSLGGINAALDNIRNSETITLTDGYYRIANAFPSFATMPAIYYESSESPDRLKWSTSALTSPDFQVNNIFKLEAGNASNEYYLYSPNAQKHLYTTNSSQSGELGTLSNENKTAVTFSVLSGAQYKMTVACNTNALHANSHNSGQGAGGTIVAWNTGANAASAWYVLPAKELSISLNNGGDDNYYATLCLPFDATISGATAYTLTLNDAQTYLTMNELSGGVVPAGTPVVLVGTSASATASIASNAATSAPLTNTSLTGCYTPVTGISNGVLSGLSVYTLGKDSEENVGFFKFTKGSSIGANKAYMTLEANAEVRGFTFNFGDINGIGGIAVSANGNTPIFDLQGRRVNSASHGIYIQNGKKILY